MVMKVGETLVFGMLPLRFATTVKAVDADADALGVAFSQAAVIPQSISARRNLGKYCRTL
jgi:hypothetical protein